VLTGIAAYLSVRFLMRYFEGKGRLAAFGLYCVIAGAFLPRLVHVASATGLIGFNTHRSERGLGMRPRLLSMR